MIEEYTLADLYLYADKIGIDYSVKNMRRLEQGLEIADNDIITPAPTAPMLPGMRAFFVPVESSTPVNNPSTTVYTVEIYDQFRSTCTCPDQHQHCKHTLAVRLHEEREKEKAWTDFSINDEEIVSQWLTLFG